MELTTEIEEAPAGERGQSLGELTWVSRLIDRGEKVTDVTAVTTGRRPELDGLRGVAVLCVMVAHSLAGVGSSKSLAPWLHSGGGLVGVQMFFVLSGFLITGILVNEHERSGTLDLARFYSRRVRRLLPALVATCAGVVAWVAVTNPEQIRLAAGSSVRALLYVGNLREHQPFHEYGPWLGHAWSLAVEEQFYLVWPVVLLAAMRLGGRRGVATVATVVLVVTMAWRPFMDFKLGYGLMRWDALAAGCLLALRPVDLRRLVVPAFVIIAAMTVTLGGFGEEDYLLATLASVTVVAAADSMSFLRAGWLRHLGTISYGLYLWHCVLLTFGMEVLLAIPATLALAELSWRFVEQRFRAKALGDPISSHERARPQVDIAAARGVLSPLQ